MAEITNVCTCVETGECTCDPDSCICDCGCDGCTTAEEGHCVCGGDGNCQCAGDEEYNNNDDAWV